MKAIFAKAHEKSHEKMLRIKMQSKKHFDSRKSLENNPSVGDFSNSLLHFNEQGLLKNILLLKCQTLVQECFPRLSFATKLQKLGDQTNC